MVVSNVCRTGGDRVTLTSRKVGDRLASTAYVNWMDGWKLFRMFNTSTTLVFDSCKTKVSSTLRCHSHTPISIHSSTSDVSMWVMKILFGESGYSSPFLSLLFCFDRFTRIQALAWPLNDLSSLSLSSSSVPFEPLFLCSVLSVLVQNKDVVSGRHCNLSALTHRLLHGINSIVELSLSNLISITCFQCLSNQSVAVCMYFCW